MSAVGRTGQWIGLLVLLGSAFVPTLQLRSFPTEHGVVPWRAAAFLTTGREVPAEVLGHATLDCLDGTLDACPLWIARRWYPWYLALLWIPALLLVWGRPSTDRRRRVIGGVLWAVSLGLLAFEGFYLYDEYLPLLPGALGRIEGVAAWLFVGALLLYRRPGHRHLGAVEATVAGQALLGFVHALTLPGTMARGWLAAYPAGTVAEAVGHNFPPAFWAGTGAMLLIALPAYLPTKGSSAPPS